MPEIAEPAAPVDHSRPRPLTLWVPILVPMIAVLIVLEIAYALVGPSCRRDTSLYFHLVLGVVLLGTVATTLMALGWRRRDQSTWQTEYGGRETRNRFMTIMGLMSGASAILLIVAQWMPVFFLSPCSLS
jgi:hypothetical protein